MNDYKNEIVYFLIKDLYQPSDFEGQRSQLSEITAASDAYKIIDAICKKKDIQIAFLSGTINPISAENFSTFLNRTYSRKIKIEKTVKGDPEAINKTQLRVIPDDSLRDNDMIVKNIVNWVNRDQYGNAVILFSKARIIKIVEKAKKKLSQSNLNDISNRGSSSRTKDAKIRAYRNSLIYTNSQLSPKEIDQKVKDFIKREFASSQSVQIERIKNKPGAMAIENRDLRDAVSYGIGFIYRQDDEDITPEDKMVGKASITENDKKIVAELFSNGKINVLLATPSIGVGVNVSIRNMYLPTLMKFEGSGKTFGDGDFSLNNKREMSQLVNRAGRGKTPISGIYTPQEFVPYMRDIISMTNDDYSEVPAISIHPTDKMIDVLRRLHDSVSEKVLKDFKKTISTTVQYKNTFMRLSMFVKQYLVRKIHSLQNIKVQIEDIQKSVNQISNQTTTLLNKIEYDIDASDRYDNLLSQKEKFQNLGKIIQKKLDIRKVLEDRLKIINQQINNIPRNTDRGSLLIELIKQRGRVEKTIIKLKSVVIDIMVDNIKELNDAIFNLKNDIKNNSTVELKQKLLDLIRIKDSLENQYKILKNRELLRSEIDNELRQVTEDIKKTYDAIEVVRKSNLPQLDETIRELNQLLNSQNKLKQNLEDKLRNLPSLRS